MHRVYKAIIVIFILLFVYPVHAQQCSAQTDNMDSLINTGGIVLQHGKNALNTLISGLKTLNKLVINEYNAKLAPSAKLVIISSKIWLEGNISKARKNIEQMLRNKLLENESINNMFKFLNVEG